MQKVENIIFSTMADVSSDQLVKTNVSNSDNLPIIIKSDDFQRFGIKVRFGDAEEMQRFVKFWILRFVHCLRS